MDLRHLTDNQLLKDTKQLVQMERDASTKILHHLREIDKRKLFCDLRCSSLHDYCIRILGYSEGSAHRRIIAARMMEEIPEIELKIESGVLNLVNIASAASFFRQEEINNTERKIEILEEVQNLTKKQCEKHLFQLSGNQIPAREQTKRISECNLKVTMILSDETTQSLDRVRGLLHKPFSIDELLQRMADITIKHLEKKKFRV